MLVPEVHDQINIMHDISTPSVIFFRRRPSCKLTNIYCTYVFTCASYSPGSSSISGWVKFLVEIFPEFYLNCKINIGKFTIDHYLRGPFCQHYHASVYRKRDQKWLVTFNLLSTTPCSRTPLFSTQRVYKQTASSDGLSLWRKSFITLDVWKVYVMFLNYSYKSILIYWKN